MHFSKALHMGGHLGHPKVHAGTYDIAMDEITARLNSILNFQEMCIK